MVKVIFKKMMKIMRNFDYIHCPEGLNPAQENNGNLVLFNKMLN
jgi:hypothetical protein